MFSYPGSKKILAYAKNNQVFQLITLYENYFKVRLLDTCFGWIKEKDIQRRVDDVILLKDSGIIYSNNSDSSECIYKYDNLCYRGNGYKAVQTSGDWYKVILPYGWVKIEKAQTSLMKIK